MLTGRPTLIAVGYEHSTPRTTTVDGKQITWNERQLGASHFGFWIKDFGLVGYLLKPVSVEIFSAVEGDFLPTEPVLGHDHPHKERYQ